MDSEFSRKRQGSCCGDDLAWLCIRLRPPEKIAGSVS